MNAQLNITRFFLALALAYIILFQMCGTGKKQPCPEIVKETIDTQRLYRQWASELKKPEPIKVIMPSKISAPSVTAAKEDSAPFSIIQSVDTAAILKDYYAQAIYSDSSEIKDGAGINYGMVYVGDTVSQNRIQARQWRFNMILPVITRTNTLSEKPRNQVYAGFSGLFSQNSLVSGAEISLSLKNKKDQQYEIAAGIYDRYWYARIGTKFKLTFK